MRLSGYQAIPLSKYGTKGEDEMASERMLVWLPSGECKGVGDQPRNMDVITRNSMKKGGEANSSNR